MNDKPRPRRSAYRHYDRAKLRRTRRQYPRSWGGQPRRRHILWWLGKPTNWIFWLGQPIVVLPAFALVFTAILLPFMLLNAEGAASFYGSYFAALTALVGVVVGNMLTAGLTLQRDDRLREQSVVAAARVSALELEGLQDHLHMCATFMRVPSVGHSIAQQVFPSLTTPKLDEHLLALCAFPELGEPLARFSRARNKVQKAVVTEFDEGFDATELQEMLEEAEASAELGAHRLNAFVQRH